MNIRTVEYELAAKVAKKAEMVRGRRSTFGIEPTGCQEKED